MKFRRLTWVWTKNGMRKSEPISYRNNYWQKRHTPKSNICNKLSQHPCKKINTGLKKLYKDKLIRYKKTNHGDDVFLNIHEKSKIEKEIKHKMDQLYNWK